MKAILTKSVLRFLILKGYKYCLSKTANVFEGSNSVCINLSPVKEKPVLQQLPLQFDTYFNIIHEPLQLADGVDDTDVYVDLNDVDLADYHGSISIV